MVDKFVTDGALFENITSSLSIEEGIVPNRSYGTVNKYGLPGRFYGDPGVIVETIEGDQLITDNQLVSLLEGWAAPPNILQNRTDGGSLSAEISQLTISISRTDSFTFTEGNENIALAKSDSSVFIEDLVDITFTDTRLIFLDDSAALGEASQELNNVFADDSFVFFNPASLLIELKTGTDIAILTEVRAHIVSPERVYKNRSEGIIIAEPAMQGTVLIEETTGNIIPDAPLVGVMKHFKAGEI